MPPQHPQSHRRRRYAGFAGAFLSLILGAPPSLALPFPTAPPDNLFLFDRHTVEIGPRINISQDGELVVYARWFSVPLASESFRRLSFTSLEAEIIGGSTPYALTCERIDDTTLRLSIQNKNPSATRGIQLTAYLPENRFNHASVETHRPPYLLPPDTGRREYPKVRTLTLRPTPPTLPLGLALIEGDFIDLRDYRDNQTRNRNFQAFLVGRPQQPLVFELRFPSP